MAGETRRGALALLAAVALLAGCLEDTRPGPDSGDEARERPLTCTGGDPQAGAELPAGADGEGGVILPNGRWLRPVGDRLNLGYKFPTAVAVAPGDDGFAVVAAHASHKLVVVEPDASAARQELTLGTFVGLRFSSDGGRLFAGGGTEGVVREFAVADGALTESRDFPVGGFVSGLDLTADDATLVVATNTDSVVRAIDLQGGAERLGKAGRWPYDLGITPDGAEAYVTNWADASVSVLDLATMETRATIPVGKNPEGVAFEAGHGGRAFVACSDADRVEVIDLARREVVETIDLSGDGLLAGSPQHLVVDEPGGRLYVTLGDRNQITLISLYDLSVIGAIPTGEYPTGIALSPDRDALWVAEAMGLGGDDRRSIPGGLARIPVPDLATLAGWTEVVDENNGRTRGFYPDPDCGNVLPVEPGDGSPIEHVVLIVKENKTYDMVLGDLEGADGDPELCVFGETITPNAHALARAFTNLDNYFSNPEVSLQGHLWTTSSDCNDFTEKARFNMLPMTGVTPEATPPGGTIFDLLLDHGVSFRNYGEIVGFGLEAIGRFEDFVDKKYPFFNMDVRDVDKAAEVIREMELGIFPRFIYIGLPNDHTFGTTAGKPTPDFLVADNDAGLGLLVDYISHSPYWEKTVIFVIEDDPQGSGDHVEGHRSICLVISPWVKRGYVSHVHYDIPSVHATIERILDLPPMNRNDGEAAPMYDVFTGTPDPAPYDALPSAIPYELNTARSVMARESAAIDFTEEDNAPGLGRILWHYRHGLDTPIPAHARIIDE